MLNNNFIRTLKEVLKTVKKVKTTEIECMSMRTKIDGFEIVVITVGGKK
jgi:hypothetical protein